LGTEEVIKRQLEEFGLKELWGFENDWIRGHYFSAYHIRNLMWASIEDL